MANVPIRLPKSVTYSVAKNVISKVSVRLRSRAVCIVLVLKCINLSHRRSVGAIVDFHKKTHAKISDLKSRVLWLLKVTASSFCDAAISA